MLALGVVGIHVDRQLAVGIWDADLRLCAPWRIRALVEARLPRLLRLLGLLGLLLGGRLRLKRTIRAWRRSGRWPTL